MKNKKFWLVITVFTISVPGFIIFSYWFLGIFSSITVSEVGAQKFTLWVGDHSGDYNKTGENVVKVSRIFASYALSCKPALIYFENAITTGKPYLKSAGGCIVGDEKLPAHVEKELLAMKSRKLTLEMQQAYKFTMYAQTAVALRKVWVEIARLTDKQREVKFPLIQIVQATGDNDFYLGRL